MTDYVQIMNVEDIPPSQLPGGHQGGTRALIVSHASTDFGSLLQGVAGIRLVYLYAVEGQQAHHLEVTSKKTTHEKVVAALNKALGNHDMSGVQKIRERCGTSEHFPRPRPTSPPPFPGFSPPWMRS